MKEKVILDTNFLIDLARFKIGLNEELRNCLDFPFEIFVLDQSLEELKDLSLKKPKTKAFFPLVKKIIEKEGIKIIKSETNKKVDQLLIDFSEKNYLIATSDKELKKKLKKLTKPVLIIRQKRFLKKVF